MTEFKNYGLSAGYLVFGLTLVILAVANLSPSSVDGTTLWAFRCGTAGLLAVLGILLAREEPLQAAVFLVAAFTYAVVSLAAPPADSAALPVLGLTYLLLAAAVLLNRVPGRLLLTVLMVLTGLNLILRYFLAPDAAGVSLGSGLCCGLAALFSLYLGLACADPQQRLPLR